MNIYSQCKKFFTFFLILTYSTALFCPKRHRIPITGGTNNLDNTTSQELNIQYCGKSENLAPGGNLDLDKCKEIEIRNKEGIIIGRGTISCPGFYEDQMCPGEIKEENGKIIVGLNKFVLEEEMHNLEQYQQQVDQYQRMEEEGLMEEQGE